MTLTADFNCDEQSQFNGPAVPYRQPTQNKKQPARCSKSEMDLLMFVTEVQRAIRAVEESSAVSALKRVLESEELSQINRAVHNTILHLNNSELATGLKKAHYMHQYFTQSIADQLRVTANDYRHQ